MDVLMIAHFTGGGRRPDDRFDTLAGILARRGAEVELVTSSFHHLSKKHRDPSDGETQLFVTTYVSEPAYRTNVSMRFLINWACRCTCETSQRNCALEAFACLIRFSWKILFAAHCGK